MYIFVLYIISYILFTHILTINNKHLQSEILKNIIYKIIQNSHIQR